MRRSIVNAVVCIAFASAALSTPACLGSSDAPDDGGRRGGEPGSNTAAGNTTAVPGTPQAVINEGVGTPSLTNDLDLAVTLAYTVRRFGDVEDLEWAADFVTRATAALRNPEAAGDDEVTSDDDVEALSVFLRLLVDDAPAPDQLGGGFIGADGAVDTDVMLARAMWCDKVPVSEGFVADVRTAGEAGGYELTHALAASQFMTENGCNDPHRVSALTAELAGRTAELLDAPGIADLALEACALLAWTGHRDLLPRGLTERVTDGVLGDGGWPEKPGDTTSDSHATAWGLRCQLELEHGATLEPTKWLLR